MSFFMPDVKFILHIPESSESALGNRALALETTLADYLRRRELNREATVDVVRHEPDGVSSIRLVVMPQNQIHECPVPEDVPSIVDGTLSSSRTTQ